MHYNPTEIVSEQAF